MPMYREWWTLFNDPLTMYREHFQGLVLSVEGVLKWLKEVATNPPYSKGLFWEDEAKGLSHILWPHIK